MPIIWNQIENKSEHRNKSEIRNKSLNKIKSKHTDEIRMELKIKSMQ